MKFNLILKRALDIIFSVIILLVIWPFLLVVALIIRIDSEGPAIFKQRRLGKNGKVFIMYKFRSMKVDSEKTGAGLFNYEGDPRVTKFGRFLRNTSIDELPQLLNVLKGELSFVGPRPPVEYELGEYSKLNRKFRKRFEVRPGITGYAQVAGRNELPWNIKVEYDNQYIDKFAKYGILLDIKIVFLTFIRVFQQRNIYEEKPDSQLDDIQAAELAEREVIRMAQEELVETNV